MKKRRIFRSGLSAALALALAVSAAPASAAPSTPDALSCRVALPSAGATVAGERVALSAEAHDAARVHYRLNGAYLGEARPTGYGWLYTPDGGQTWGWDSSSVANGTHALTCVASSSSGQSVTSAPVSIVVGNPTGCEVLVPDGSRPASGTQVIMSAASHLPETTKVEYYLHSKDTAVIALGEAKLTGYGWLYTPDGGQTWGWDSTQVPLGVYSLTCTATGPDGVRHTSPAVVFTVDNVTPHDWGSYCADHVPTTPADYQTAFDYRSGGWAGADGAHPIPLPDGRVMWLFGDTLAGQIDENNALKPGWRMPSNSVQIQSGTCLTPVMGGTPQAAESFLTDESNRRYWPANGYVDTTVSPPVLRITATHVVNGECGWFRLAGVRVFTLSLPGLQVVSSAPAPYDATASNVPSFGTWLFADEDYVYLYGGSAGFQCERDENGPYPDGMYVARTAPSALATGPWQYWAGDGWSADITSAAPMTWGDGWYQATVKYGDEYLTTSREPVSGAFSSPVYAWSSSSPSGPWEPVLRDGEPANIVPEDVGFPQGRWHYGGIVITEGVPGATASQPLLVFSTNGLGCNPSEGTPCTPDNDITKNVLLYGPHFVRPLIPPLTG